MMNGEQREQNRSEENHPTVDHDDDYDSSLLSSSWSSLSSLLSSDQEIPNDFDRTSTAPGPFVVSVKGVGRGTNANAIRPVIIPPLGCNGEAEKAQQMVDYVKKQMKVKENKCGGTIVHCYVEGIKDWAEIGMEMAIDRRAKYKITFGKKQLKQQQMGLEEALIIGTFVVGIIVIGLFKTPDFGFKFWGQQEEMKGAETKEMMDWKRLAEEMKVKVWELEETLRKKCSELAQTKEEFRAKEEGQTKKWEEKLDEMRENFQEKLDQKKETESQLNAKLEKAQKEVKRMKAVKETLLDKSADMAQEPESNRATIVNIGLLIIIGLLVVALFIMLVRLLRLKADCQSQLKRLRAEYEGPIDKSADLVITKSDMSLEMQEAVKKCVKESMDKCNTERNMAEYIKQHFDENYGKYWHCIVGRFGAYYHFDRQSFIQFSLGQKVIVLYKGVKQ